MTDKRKGGGCHPRQLQKALDDYLSAFEFTKPMTKRKRILALLIVASRAGCRITRFDATYCGDFVFNTTVSEIGRTDLITISRANTQRPTRWNVPVHCKEYWLDLDQIERAESILSRLVRPEAD